MTRMTKEFSLVLLGTGLLTAGYFLWPEDDMERHAQEKAKKQIAGNHRTHHGMHMIFIPTPRYGAGNVATKSVVSRGGFGSTGHSASGIG